MRRQQHKPNHTLQSNYNEDVSYRFWSLQYLNFTLDQISLLQQQVSNIHVQDIEKIKRMLQDGQKMQLQTQQTGQFINYDLLQKKKFHLEKIQDMQQNYIHSTIEAQDKQGQQVAWYKFQKRVENNSDPIYLDKIGMQPQNEESLIQHVKQERIKSHSIQVHPHVLATNPLIQNQNQANHNHQRIQKQEIQKINIASGGEYINTTNQGVPEKSSKSNSNSKKKQQLSTQKNKKVQILYQKLLEQKPLENQTKQLKKGKVGYFQIIPKGNEYFKQATRPIEQIYAAQQMIPSVPQGKQHKQVVQESLEFVEVQNNKKKRKYTSSAGKVKKQSEEKKDSQKKKQFKTKKIKNTQPSGNQASENKKADISMQSHHHLQQGQKNIINISSQHNHSKDSHAAALSHENISEKQSFLQNKSLEIMIPQQPAAVYHDKPQQIINILSASASLEKSAQRLSQPHSNIMHNGQQLIYNSQGHYQRKDIQNKESLKAATHSQEKVVKNEQQKDKQIRNDQSQVVHNKSLQHKQQQSIKKPLFKDNKLSQKQKQDSSMQKGQKSSKLDNSTQKKTSKKRRKTPEEKEQMLKIKQRAKAERIKERQEKLQMKLEKMKNPKKRQSQEKKRKEKDTSKLEAKVGQNKSQSQVRVAIMEEKKQQSPKKRIQIVQTQQQKHQAAAISAISYPSLSPSQENYQNISIESIPQSFIDKSNYINNQQQQQKIIHHSKSISNNADTNPKQTNEISLGKDSTRENFIKDLSSSLEHHRSQLISISRGLLQQSSDDKSIPFVTVFKPDPFDKYKRSQPVQLSILQKSDSQNDSDDDVQKLHMPKKKVKKIQQGEYNDHYDSQNLQVYQINIFALQSPSSQEKQASGDMDQEKPNVQKYFQQQVKKSTQVQKQQQQNQQQDSSLSASQQDQ